MTKRRIVIAKDKPYPVRNFPSDLLKRLRRLKDQKGINIYVLIRDAVREKLDRDYPE